MCITLRWLKCLYVRVVSSPCHPWWAFDRLFLVASSFCLSPCFSPLLTSSLPHSTCTLTCTPSMWTAPRETPAAPSPNEEYCTLAIYHPPTGYEPNVLDDFHYSEIPEMTFQEESCDKDGALVLVWRGTRRWDHWESAIFTTVHSGARRTSEPETNLSLSWRKFVASSVLFHTQERGDPYQERGDPYTNLVRVNENQVAKWENETIRILLERQKEKILSGVRTETQKHKFQADSDWRSIQELNGIIEFQRREIDHALAGDEQFRRDQLLLHEQLSEQNRDLREAHMKSLHEMKELKRVQGSRFDGIFEKKIDRKSRHY